MDPKDKLQQQFTYPELLEHFFLGDVPETEEHQELEQGSLAHDTFLDFLRRIKHPLLLPDDENEQEALKP